MVADKPVKGFLGRRGLCRKWPPTEDTEKELHMDPMVPTEDTEAVSRLSSATGDAHPESLSYVSQRTNKSIVLLTCSPVILRSVPASKRDDGSSRYWISSSEDRACDMIWKSS